MRYLLLLYGEPVRPETLTPEQWQGVVETHTRFHRELTEAGAWPGLSLLPESSG